MKHILTIAIVLIGVLTTIQAANAQQSMQDYVPNQVIVKFKPGQSPQELKAQVEKRSKERQSFFGFFKFLILDIKTTLKKEETPEERKAKLEDVEKKIGVVKSEALYKGKDEKAQTFVFTFQNGSVEEAVTLYKSLSIVEYAEPNYKVSIF